MAINEEVDSYLRDIYLRSLNPDEAMPGEPVEETPVFDYRGAAAERFTPRAEMMRQAEAMAADVPLVSLATGQDIPESASVQDVAEMERAAYAQRKPKESPGPTADSYLSALRQAQRQDIAMQALGGVLSSAEQIARIQSRGAFQPTGRPPMPSAVSQLEQRQRAIADYLERQRGLRAETRAERASEAQAEIARAQAAREQARMNAEELRLAIEANESPERVQKLRADTMASLERANLYATQAEAAAKGKQAKLVVGGAASPKTEKPAGRPLPATETRELADFSVAEGELDSLLKSFEKRDMAGASAGLAARGAEMFGMKGTQSAAYMAEARRAMQAVGTILEGGKLAAGDELKYRRMLPEPGDSLENARLKVDGLKKYLRDLRDTRAQAFRAGGFQVGEQSSIPAAAAQRSPLAAAAEAAVQAAEAARAAGKPKAEIDVLTKKAEAAIEAASKGD